MWVGTSSRGYRCAKRRGGKKRRRQWRGITWGGENSRLGYWGDEERDRLEGETGIRFSGGGAARRGERRMEEREKWRPRAEITFVFLI